MIAIQQLPSHVYVLPTTLGATIVATAEELACIGEQAMPSTVLYAEKVGGFQCRSCVYAQPTNATHGACRIMQGSIHLDEGCCAAWTANKKMLHLYREK